MLGNIFGLVMGFVILIYGIAFLIFIKKNKESINYVMLLNIIGIVIIAVGTITIVAITSNIL